MRDLDAPLGTDASAHQFPCGPDSGHLGEGPSGESVVDSGGSLVAQTTLVLGDHLPVGQGPVDGSVSLGSIVAGAW